MRIQWYGKDQLLLDELLERKSAFEAQSIGPLVAVLERMACFERLAQIDDLVKIFRRHADDLRDALKPFDSGMRGPSAEP